MCLNNSGEIIKKTHEFFLFFLKKTRVRLGLHGRKSESTFCWFFKPTRFARHLRCSSRAEVPTVGHFATDGRDRPN
jgi:hypothetical protein